MQSESIKELLQAQILKCPEQEYLAVRNLSSRRFSSSSKKPLMQRFFEKIAYGASDCWYWVATTDQSGYGLINAMGETRAHRLSWRLLKGNIPNGMSVLHKCDVRGCVNPEHLFLGTQLDNMRDCKQKGRIKPPKGRCGQRNPMSRLTEDNVQAIRSEYSAGGISQKKLAIKYKVAVMTVNQAIRRISWAKV